MFLSCLPCLLFGDMLQAPKSQAIQRPYLQFGVTVCRVMCGTHTHTLTDTRNLMGLKPLAAGAEMQEPDALPCGILTLAILKVEGWAWQRGNWVLSNCMLRSLSPPT